MSADTSKPRNQKGSSAASRSSGGAQRARRLDPPAPEPGTGEPDGGFRPWHFFLIASLLAAGAGMVAVRGAAPPHVTFVALGIGSAGVAAFLLYLVVWPLVGPAAVAGPDMLGGRTRAALDREKAAVLRAIKELEFDRAMGKVSEADFQDMSGRLRARAVRLIKQLDTGTEGYRELIERELAARRAAAEGRPAATAREVAASGVVEAAARPQPQAAASSTCSGCGTLNDPDAQFCKQCGRRLFVSS